MSDLRELYQEVILDHNKSPRHFGVLAKHNHLAHGHNPLCGDKLNVFLQVDAGKITDISFEGSGCAISKASASLMTDFLLGKSIDDAKNAFVAFHALVTTDMDHPVSAEGLGKLAVFSGVREFPSRVKCAMLAWRTMDAALNDRKEEVTTE